MTTLVIDTGDNIVGIYAVEDKNYTTYRGRDISLAIRRIILAEEVVTYNGERHDLAELGRFAGRSDELALEGSHTDMRSICWSDRILGSGLHRTYSKHFSHRPVFPKTHEGSNECDVYMTFKLWELWKQGKLKILDGHELKPPHG